MVHALVLIATGILVPLLAFLTWRRARLRGGTAALLGLMSTLWWAELLLTVHDVARWVAPAEPPGHPVRGILPWVAGHTVLDDHAARPDHDRTVAFVGDSITYGQGVRAAETFPRRVGEALTAAGDPTRVLVHAAQSRSLWDEAVL
ncbi:MAG: hypothetical protein KC656_34845, partial [Myxococcales bacterium]|nr:hypothetical protein [Myxococcales bacterium]